ncbi:SHOCT domain-containing protein, partial [Achromobacter pulmonis]|uniref:SHOCT domain-containing protein n=4 Tax=Achromobacter TaxID=222 RepID=UPI0015826931
AGAPAAAGAAAGAAASGGDPVQRLQQLKDLLDKGLITPADYDTAKAEVLKKLTS